jgi:hypothetical protein
MSSARLVFMLGGHDLEMATIRELLSAHAPCRCLDKGLSWGAKASDYADDIRSSISLGQVPVLVELDDDLGLNGPAEKDGPPHRAILVDHHGRLAGKDQPTSLHQVFSLLELAPALWTRWFELVAANDRGYIPALLECGATRDEIVKVRAADRAAQGITLEQEEQGERAVRTRQVLARGRLTVVALPHNRCAAVADRLEPEMGGPGYENLLIISPGSVNIFGLGSLIIDLSREFPEGYFGGALPDRGFWGHPLPLPTVLAFVLHHL